jgi:hypothetical protein
MAALLGAGMLPAAGCYSRVVREEGAIQRSDTIYEPNLKDDEESFLDDLFPDGGDDDRSDR